MLKKKKKKTIFTLMLINIANFPIEIDDQLLNDKTNNYLNSFKVISTDTQIEKPFIATLINKPYFLKNKSVTERFGSLQYQEYGNSVIIIDDTFSYLKIDITEKCMQVYPKKKRYLKELDFVTDLKVLLSLLVLDKGGLLLHSSAVIRNSEVLLFSGPSGAGKSTIAQLLCPPLTLINDEYNILLPSNSTVQVFTTPFGKMKGSQKYHPSARYIFSLTKSDTHKINGINPKEAFLRLAGNVCTLPTSEYFGNKLLENIKNCIDKVPVYELYFNNDPSLQDFLISMDG